MTEMGRKTITIVNYWSAENAGQAMVTLQINNGQIRMETEEGIKVQDAEASWKRLEKKLRNEYL